MNKHYLELQNVSKKIKNKIIIHDTNIKLENRKIWGFVGANGSGKTMLFRMISNLVHPSKGQILYDGLPYGKTNMPSIGIIIENASLFPDLTAFENLKYLASIRNVISSEEIISSLKKVGLNPEHTLAFKKYSLGMKQRLLLAQAIMEKPDILILDEPTNGIDPEGRELFIQIIKEQASRGAIVLISSHLKSDIEQLCDHVFNVHNGTITDMNFKN